jgi:tuftelin-interacting protein 11
MNNKLKIIDMTGREQKVVHGYESLSQLKFQQQSGLANRDRKNNFDVLGLLENVDLVVNQTEDKILNFDKKKKHYEDMIISCTYEEKRTQDLYREEEEYIKRMNDLLESIQR